MIVRTLIPVLLMCGGCGSSGFTAQDYTLAEVIPPGAVAAPWILEDKVWNGTFAEAAPALGDDAEAWGSYAPERVWLAIYRHDTHDDRRLTVRAFSFGSAAEARSAYDFFGAVADARSFDIADGGAWTELGVLFVWGRLVFEIFGDSPTVASQLQSACVAAVIEKRMPPRLPETPR